MSWNLRVGTQPNHETGIQSSGTDSSVLSVCRILSNKSLIALSSDMAHKLKNIERVVTAPVMQGGLEKKLEHNLRIQSSI